MSGDMSEMVKTIIQTQVIQALNNAPEAIEKLVKAVLNGKVDRQGKPSEYSHGDDMPYLDWLVGSDIRAAISNAVREVIREREPAIKELVRQGLSSDSVVDAVAKAVTRTAETDWKIDVRFDVDKDRR